MTTQPAVAAPHVPAGLPDHLPHFVDGERRNSADGDTFEVADPVSNRPYATASAGRARDVDLAVAAARRAFAEGPWPLMTGRARARVLYRIADLIEDREARLAEWECFDTGLPITQALGRRGGRRRTSASSPTWSPRRPTRPTRCPASSSTTSTASRPGWPG